MGETWLMAVISLLLLLGSFFFVAAEYAIVSSRKSRLDALAKKGSRPAKRLAKQLEDISPLVAASQIGITMIGIGVGSITEPFVTNSLVGLFGRVENATVERLIHILSFLLITYFLVVLGELVPKYLSLRMPEKMALVLFRPMLALVVILRPIIWLAQASAKLVVRMLGIKENESDSSVAKEELMMLVQSGGAEGTLDKIHADMVARALRLDVLAARDIMIHRLDIKWLDATADRDQLRKKLKEIPFTRIPVCNGDIDEMIGIAYLHDIFKNWETDPFDLSQIARPVVAIPENLTLEKIVTTMRENKTQMLIVMDEYGGTSGLITLEDVVEEVFGELEDRLESERPPIEIFANGRVSARAEIRVDELINYLNLDTTIISDRTETLATIIVNELSRVPRPGDSVETKLGKMRVENVARRRITRVSILLNPKLYPESEEE